MKKLNFLFSFIFLFFVTTAVNSQNVIVNPGAGSYPTLKDAFDAINAGTHTGAITINVVGNTTETATAVLNSSGTGSTSYTSVFMSPSGAPRIIEGSLSGDTTGSIIKFAGADSVTIDGRIGGTGRNLTVRNNAAIDKQACIFLSTVIAGADTNGCQDNIIRNLELSCGADQTSNYPYQTIGIVSGMKFVSRNTPGRNNDRNLYVENRIVNVSHGIVLDGGVAFNLNSYNVISDNIIGPDAFGPDQIGKAGIYVTGQNECVISCNTIQNVGTNNWTPGASANVDLVGIGLGLDFWAATFTGGNSAGTNNLVTANTIINVQETQTLSAVGIICALSAPINGGVTNNEISNNIIYNVRANGNTSTGENHAAGIGYLGGSSTINAKGDRIIYNSIYMSGLSDPAPSIPSNSSTVGIKVNSQAATNDLTIKNNSVYLDVTSSNNALLHYCITAPSAAYDWGAGGCNNNNYYFPVANTQMRTGGFGRSTPYVTSFLTLALWQGAFSVPGPQDGASLQADPLYTLLPTTNPLIPQTGSPLVAAGTPIPGITLDVYQCVQSELRNATAPTIGAWEYTEGTLPVELASFTSNVNGKDANLNWSTVSELNNAGFDIERSSANSSWARIGNVAGNGTTTSVHNYSYNDRNLASGNYSYRLKQIDFNGNFEYFNLSSDVSIGIPAKFDLSQNYPNPFNPSTSINFDLPYDSKVSIKLFDLSGREVATLVNEVKTAGYYSVNFNASSLSSGVYFYTISADNFTATKKMMLLK